MTERLFASRRHIRSGSFVTIIKLKRGKSDSQGLNKAMEREALCLKMCASTLYQEQVLNRLLIHTANPIIVRDSAGRKLMTCIRIIVEWIRK